VEDGWGGVFEYWFFVGWVVINLKT
jgi:hypothetical protein